MRELLAKKNQLNKIKEKIGTNEQKNSQLAQKTKTNDSDHIKRRFDQCQ